MDQREEVICSVHQMEGYFGIFTPLSSSFYPYDYFFSRKGGGCIS